MTILFLLTVPFVYAAIWGWLAIRFVAQTAGTRGLAAAVAAAGLLIAVTV